MNRITCFERIKVILAKDKLSKEDKQNLKDLGTLLHKYKEKDTYKAIISGGVVCITRNKIQNMIAKASVYTKKYFPEKDIDDCIKTDIEILKGNDRGIFVDIEKYIPDEEDYYSIKKLIKDIL